MSEYTIINFIPDGYSAEEFKTTISVATRADQARCMNNDSLVYCLIGGDKYETVKNSLRSKKDSKLLYNAPLEVRADTDEFIGYLVIAYYEDTGDHFETELFKVSAFSDVEKIDEKTMHDDRIGDKIDGYYEEMHNIQTELTPP